MSIMPYQGVCFTCGHDHNDILFRAPFTPLGDAIARGETVYSFGLHGRVVLFADYDGKPMIQIETSGSHAILGFGEFTALHKALQAQMFRNTELYDAALNDGRRVTCSCHFARGDTGMSICSNFQKGPYGYCDDCCHDKDCNVHAGAPQR